ncbi:hypothetical protein [Agromyces larvae]|uniref:Uncharacterized protein n=1 Tax=Agromyces larvae TaxID=2929802 RepID=A0ABY4CB37_9MICO|nr:hypothetical protein [Agromyces larvae]UOE45910.1 hypothetical protein MTO99_09275 [Agromyces larvae]
MSIDNLDSLLSGGTKSAKFENPGDTITGVITEVTTRQKTEFGTGKPQFWDDGLPQQQIVVTIQTTLAEDEDDDGLRAIYIKGWGAQLKAFRAAVQAAGAKPEKGDDFTATFTGYGPKAPTGGFPPKTYQYAIRKLSQIDALVGGPAAAAPAAPTTPAAATPTAANPAAEQAKGLIGLGLSDEQITAATGLDATVVALIRSQTGGALAAAAGAQTGF